MKKSKTYMAVMEGNIVCTMIIVVPILMMIVTFNKRVIVPLLLEKRRVKNKKELNC